MFPFRSVPGRRSFQLLLLTLLLAAPLLSQQPHSGGEASLVLPDLDQATFLGGIGGRALLMLGLIVCVLGLVFGLAMYQNLRKLPVHSSMREISELIYETCKTYLITQGKFLLLLELFIGAIIVFYFGFLQHFDALKVLIILLFSLIGIGGSFAVAWFGIRVNTFANSRTAFAALTGLPFLCYAIPLKAGISIGMLLISVELFLMLVILLFIPGDYAGPCFIGFAIGESLGAAALRVAGGIFTKIADIGADLMKIVFKIKEDDARNPGVIADCTGDNAGDSVGPSADGFETYGVTGVALISFILLAVNECPGQGTAACLDLCHAHDDGRSRPVCLISSTREWPKPNMHAAAEDELRSAANKSGLAYFDCFGRDDLRRFLPADSRSRRRYFVVVETFHCDHVRHNRGRDDSGDGEDVHLDRLRACAGSGDGIARRRRVTEYPVGVCSGKLQRILAGHGDMLLMGIAYGVSKWVS